MQNVKELLMDTPVIAAVKSDMELTKALESDCKVIFLLFGTILNAGELVQRVQSRNKACFVHMDLLEGLSNREIAVDAVAKLSHPDGIISTRSPLIRRAQQLGLLAIQRMFLLDSMSVQNILAQIDSIHPDYIEVLPGIVPTVIQELTHRTETPLIAGGLIRSKQDVILALQAGVLAVSTSCQAVWTM